MRSTIVCSARRSETNETVPEPWVVRAPSHLTQADDVSVPRSFGVPSVIERIHPPIAASVWVLSAALVDSRIVLPGKRFLGVGPDSVFRRLLVRADVLLRVRIAAHGFLRARLVRTRRILPNRLFMADIVSLDWFVGPMPGLRYGFVGAVISLAGRRRPMSPGRGRPSSTGVVCTTSVTGILLCIRVKFVGMLQPAVVLEPFGLHSFFALRGLGIQLFSLGRLTISLGSSSIGLSLCALCICPLFLDFGLSSTNIMFGFGSLLPNLRGLLPLVFALLRCRLSADCDDDADDDQDHDDGDDDPDDG
ncbi:hypothetical protein BI49514_01800 [Brevibacterium iodinum ATCC 49514]|uniref:Uncharacterized protein n=1 Tax=Brevibacterium iodinum ATCC 49514 TaxID=1255616 RepID=A0A2H1JAP3_9MICO|nr:hypothetical protein BI49514_01800 [Brevibacterium iodinum ATCC 49514]SUW12886.1 Uncharacterised protein [Brevibacterium iodinum]